MKTKNIKTIISSLIIFIIFLISSVNAQTPLPPSDHGEEKDALPSGEGGSAPIGGGLIILVSLGIGYGFKKVYDYRKSLKE